MDRRRNHIGRSGLLAGIALAALAPAAPAFAQATTTTPDAGTAPAASPPSGGGLEDIVVTARRRSENLERTPISITAVTATQLEARGITSVNKIQDFTPNLTFSNSPTNSGVASNAAIYIRGIGQNDFAPSVEPGVGIYLDGVYIGTPVGSVFDLIDVERVEVLRGPQGTLFGRNTIGGAVSVSTIQPNDRFAFKADVKYGTDNRINGRAFVNVPVTDQLFFKLTAGIFSQDGYVDAPFQGKHGDKLGNQDTKTVRGAIRWAPSSDFDATLAADYTHDSSNGSPGVVTGINPNETGSLATLNNALAVGNPALCFAPANAGNTACYNNRIVSKTTNYGTDPDFSRIKAWSTTLTMKWNLAPNAQIKSITAYRRTDGHFAKDFDGSNVDLQYLEDFYRQKQFSEELQLTGKALENKLDYVFGLYYFKEKGFDINPVTFNILKEQSGGYFDYDSWAGFAQGTYHFSDKLSLTAGLRYTQDNKDFLPDQFYISTIGAPILSIPPGTRIVPFQHYKNNADKWTPMANLSYQFTDALMGYVTFSQGFKGGGFTQRLTDPATSLPSFKPETVTSYEGGLKFSGLDNRLRVNAAGYYMFYNDVQLLVADSSRIGPFYTNAGRAHISGFEFETEFAPGGGWRFSASAGMTDARFVHLDASVQGLTLDSKFVLVSKWSLSGSIEKDFDLDTLGTLTPRADWSYRSGYFTNVNGINDPMLYQPGYSIVNLSLRWRAEDKRYSVTLGMDNATDKKFRTFGNYQPAFGFYTEAFDRGRQVYVQAGVSF
jgi:iron complex outermembrane receptor protein